MPLRWSVFIKVPNMLKKNVHSPLVRCKVLCVSASSKFIHCSVQIFWFLNWFCEPDSSVVYKVPVIMTGDPLYISPCNSVNFAWYRDIIRCIHTLVHGLLLFMSSFWTFQESLWVQNTNFFLWNASMEELMVSFKDSQHLNRHFMHPQVWRGTRVEEKSRDLHHACHFPPWARQGTHMCSLVRAFQPGWGREPKPPD